MLVGLCLWGQGWARVAWGAEAQTDKHALWQVEGKGAKVYLLGSIHFLKEEYYPLAEPIEQAFKGAKTVVFETSFKELKSPGAVAKMAMTGMCPKGKTIKDYLSQETYAALQKKLEKSLGTGTAFDALKPWMAAVSLLVFELQRLGFNPEHGVDQHFYSRAEKDSKEIVPLETVEFQLQLFADLTEKDQDSFLKQTLEEIDQFKEQFDEITDAWKRGQADRLAELLLESMRGYPGLYQKLLVDRNKAWVPKIEELLAGDKPAFVVVGAGHLVGKDSVVALLQKKGFKVKQL